MDRHSPASDPPWFFYPDTPLSEDNPGRMIMFHGRDPRWLLVNATTREIAGFLADGSGLEEAAAALAARYGLGETEARRDVDRVADELRRRGFLGSPGGGPERRTAVAESLFLHITDRCNFSCVHCYKAGAGEVTDMPLEAACRLIDEAAASGAQGVTISGGEPLLHPRARDLISHAARKVRVRLLTNGSLVDEPWAAFLSEAGALVQVSVDGADEATHDRIRTAGSFIAAMRAVELLQQAGMGERVNLSTTIMAQNLDQLSGIIRLAEQRRVPLVRFLPLGRRGRAAANWDRIGAGVSKKDHEAFYRLVMGEQRGGSCSVNVSCGLSGFLLEISPDISSDGIWCSVGRTLVVDVDGSAYPCVLMMREEFCLGNVLRDGLQACLGHRNLVSACSALSERPRRIPECADCHWRNLCQAGCMGQALDHCGTIWGRDDFCAYRREAYQDAFDGILHREKGACRGAGEVAP